jgi:exodeoxyribonuclease VII small subunit
MWSAAAGLTKNLRDEGERIVENQNEKSVSSLQDVNGIEEAFAMLEKILARMDEDGVTLKESFDCYEQGMKLIKYCNETIDTVEKKVQILSAGGETDEF